MESTRHTHTKFSHPLATLAITFILGILSVELFPAKIYIYVLVGPIAGVLCLLSVVRGRMGTAGCVSRVGFHVGRRRARIN